MSPKSEELFNVWFGLSVNFENQQGFADRRAHVLSLGKHAYFWIEKNSD